MEKMLPGMPKPKAGKKAGKMPMGMKEDPGALRAFLEMKKHKGAAKMGVKRG